jgi:hypothetical protein
MDEPDAQTRAFTDATPEELVSDGAQALLADSLRHPASDNPYVHSPADWDAAGWDDEREGPGTLEHAKAALAARIADPAAPDGPEVAGAYDQLEEQ